MIKKEILQDYTKWTGFHSWFSKQVSRTLNIKWKLHTAYRPQSSGMVEWTNWTCKETLLYVDHRDWRFLGGLDSDASAQTQDDLTVPWLVPIGNCVGEAPSHNKTDVEGLRFHSRWNSRVRWWIRELSLYKKGCHSPLGSRLTNLCPGIRCGQGLETRLLGPTLEGSIYCCSNQPCGS